jgi:hypothetical protein
MRRQTPAARTGFEKPGAALHVARVEQAGDRDRRCRLLLRR